MSSIDRLLAIIPTYLPRADLDLVRRAHAFSSTAHRGQKRLTGEEYVEHSTRVAIILAERLHADIPTMIGGLLHDVIEDTGITEADVVEAFGKEVAELVVGCTVLHKVQYRGIERYIESMRKLFVAMAKDLRVILIKFADRLDNLQTLYAHTPEKSMRIARETLEIYAPIADRLGVGELKGDLEDYSFPYVYPKEYEIVKKAASDRLREKEKVVERITTSTEEHLKREHMPFLAIHGRRKHLFRLYQKIIRHNPNLAQIENTLDQIYDLVAVRIIVETIPQCYAALGLIHSFCTPLTGRIKDYIANPKPNGYQSLHTTVWCAVGKDEKLEVVEFQIRTQSMHDEAEYGTSTHWHYSERGRSIAPKRNLAWVTELTKWKKELKENQQYLESLKIDVLQDRIFVRTPKGDWIDLPEGSTPVDFAYHVHSELGNKCSHAKINGSFAPLETPLQNHDVVEIITDKKRKGPDPKWLAFVKTPSARAKIREKTKGVLFDWLKNIVTPKDKTLLLQKKKKGKK